MCCDRFQVQVEEHWRLQGWKQNAPVRRVWVLSPVANLKTSAVCWTDRRSWWDVLNAVKNWCSLLSKRVKLSSVKVAFKLPALSPKYNQCSNLQRQMRSAVASSATPWVSLSNVNVGQRQCTGSHRRYHLLIRATTDVQIWWMDGGTEACII